MAESPPPVGKHEIRPLTGLRGVAALSVALGHLQIARLTPVLTFMLWKNAAVDLFFCLSGFTLCLAYQAGASRQLRFGDYLVARIARVYPLYILSLAVSVMMVATPVLYNEEDKRVVIGDLIRQLTMTNAWPFIGSGIHWNFPAWSISVEFFCYLFAFPAIFYLTGALGRIPWPVRAVLAVAAMAGSAVLFLTEYDQRIIGAGRSQYTAFPEIAYAVNLIRGVLGFLAGWLVYRSYLARDALWRWASRWADLSACAAIVVLIAAAFHLMPNQYMLAIFPLLVLGLTTERSLTGRFLAWGPVHYLGRISYSIYIIHFVWFIFIHHTLNILPGAALGDPLQFTALIAGLLLVSALSYHLLEMPLRRVVRELFGSRRPIGRRHIRVSRIATVAGFLVVVFMLTSRSGVLRPILYPAVALGQEIAAGPTFRSVARDGWSYPEKWGVWTKDRRATLQIPLAAMPTAGLRLSVKGVFFVQPDHETVSASFSANGVPIGILKGTLAASAAETVFDIPQAAFAALPRELNVTIVVDKPVSPHALKLSDDRRALGFGLQSMRLVDGGGVP
ncbi:MAG TPA: acyltransferase [Alphaproteobacteria bacterium]|jgi:peptidoglycan/LPS O-acetylase OafA/YrhL|nr:acyltransferase [Alphaproteobacteria bacterium]